MFNLRIAEYIKRNMQAQHMTYKELEARSGVPLSTLHSYAQAKVTKHTKGTLESIAVALGDDKQIIEEIRNASEDAIEQEKKLLEASKDAERMAQLAALIRSNVSQILEEYRLQSIEQQRETSAHADERIAEAERKAAERIEEAERKASERMQQVVKQCEEHEQQYRQHCEDIMDAERRGYGSSARIEIANKTYLHILIRNLTIALIIVSILAAGFGAYAIYAYSAFDRADPTRGLYQLE